MPYIIINADDFGLAPGVTEGIVRCGTLGFPLSTSAMTCLDGAEDLIRKNAPRLQRGIGLHLQLTQGIPASAPEKIPGLVMADGCFPPHRPAPGLDREEILIEWKAQLQRLRSWGVEPDHLDTHHHLHARPEQYPEILSAFANLALELKLPARSGDRVVTGFLRQRGVICPDLVISFSELAADVDSLIGALEVKHDGHPAFVAEIGCHPGYWDEELGRRSRPKYAQLRELELEALVHGGLPRKLRERGWTLIRYGDLAGIEMERA
jgi:predicted glycoside hydrolase/deacetylase ChbG (UPF0249 family)